jgi:hypothetical protein
MLLLHSRLLFFLLLCVSLLLHVNCCPSFLPALSLLYSLSLFSFYSLPSMLLLCTSILNAPLLHALCSCLLFFLLLLRISSILRIFLKIVSKILVQQIFLYGFSFQSILIYLCDIAKINYVENLYIELAFSYPFSLSSYYHKKNYLQWDTY